ncbi:DegT/DnrJ/EryC1/StrS family aminotransferase [Extibacter muris]|uniref:DegT/DnrJ/EryC1/StrS family aminotransferase n=1 Tax=Extibacter muris TaxID=1796622 RepID=UPI001D06DC11|nr:DegT/DnrJ/EryC1/StrS family aminotransferase [Extibacter muris]MCB6203668.1 DegT/DnrJ/EryC1/StrS family aminotransferase [Extibacter muris]MCQ4665222.1 DegT/DnrJ/EryC1/StrS family aminotransferase [Extibacter muris]MCQ4694636.1 DegT/DnrJ/EryC1/StrS family aminotransferase [Extibacter muris]
MQVPFLIPDITDVEIEEVTDTLRSGWITTGPKTKKLEMELAKFCGVNKFICLNSATACIEIALRVLGIGPGDEVITTAYTYTASASVVCHVGAKLILVDTAKDSYEMDYGQLADAITEKTKAIIPVDLGGIMCDYDMIFSIVSNKKGLYSANNEIQKTIGRIAVIADSAHALGASQKGKKCGEVADFTCFSFHAVKNFTTGEGGGLTWKSVSGISDAEIYKRLSLLTLHGQSKDALEKTKLGEWEYDVVGTFYKYNMTDISAALGIAQLKRYPSMLRRRKEIILEYDEAFRNMPLQILNHYGTSFCSSGHLYCVRVHNKDRRECNYIMELMAELGIATNVHYKPLPMLSAYKNLGFDIQNYPNAFALFSNEITLPLYSRMTEDAIDYTIQSFKSVLNEV